MGRRSREPLPSPSSAACPRSSPRSTPDQDINVTLGYKAVYPDEAVQAHLAFLARRRAMRPTDEYRVPTDKEWTEFLGHFERGKVSIGTCGRSFSASCSHEHACVRCPMLRPDPD
jgi:hypothetical protein